MSYELPKNFLDYAETRKAGFMKVKNLKDEGKLVAGIFCTFTPQEILDAAGFTSVSLCGMSAETIPDAEKELPKNLCPLIKSSYGFMVSEKCPYTYFADLIVGETTCDGKKKMYELMGKKKKVFILHLPQGLEPYAIKMWNEEIHRFIDFIKSEFGVEITDEKLRAAVHLRNIERVERMKLMEVQKSIPPKTYGKNLYQTFDSIGFLFDEEERIDKIVTLRKEIEEKFESGGGPVGSGAKRILVTGCPIGGVLEKTVGTIESKGGVVVCFENCSGLKACMEKVDETADDIVMSIAERYLKIGCAVMTPNTKRMNNLKSLIKEFNVDGVVDISLHACTTYIVESESVGALMKELNVPFLSIETDYEKGDEGQLATRIEAFLEMLN